MVANQITQASAAVLHPATHMGLVTLAVADVARSIAFYTDVLGMKVLDRGANENATLGTATNPLLHLKQIPNAKPQPMRTTGLYHVAILVPSRSDLGRVLLNLSRTKYPVQGFGDHLVSEAIYLADPDGNGLEIYRDRPRDEWKWDGSQVRMATDPLDLDGIIASVPDPDAPFAGMPDGTTIGHMHLRVGEIGAAKAFYVGVIGFEIVAEMPTALFVSAGGYHHHVGMNIWQSRGAPRPPADSVGLREFVVILPNDEARAQLVARLDNDGIVHEEQAGDLIVNDPWGNRLRVVTQPTYGETR